MTTIWQTLDLEPTLEPGLIRKAYARRLKVTRPDDDPVGFATLRAAYEHALAACDDAVLVIDAPPDRGDTANRGDTAPHRGDERQADADRRDPETDSAVGARVEEHSRADPRQESLRAAIIAAITADDPCRAAQLFQDADAAETLSLPFRMRFEEELAHYLLTSDALLPEAVTETIAHMGWTRDQCTGDSRFDHILRALFEHRVDHTEWLASLQKLGRDWRYWYGHREATAARIVLGRGRAFLSCIALPHEHITHLLKEIKVREAAIGRAFDPVRLNHLIEVLKKPVYLTSGLIPIMFVVALCFLHLLGVEHAPPSIGIVAAVFRSAFNKVSRRSTIVMALMVLLLLVALGFSRGQTSSSTTQVPLKVGGFNGHFLNICPQEWRYARNIDVAPLNLTTRPPLADPQPDPTKSVWPTPPSPLSDSAFEPRLGNIGVCPDRP